MFALLLLLGVSAWAAEAPGVEAFEERWRRSGRSQAVKPWMRERRVVVLDAGLPGEAAEVEAALAGQLRELEASFEVLRAPVPRSSLDSCVRDGVLDSRCLGRKARLLRADPPFKGSILVFVLPWAIDLLPRPGPEGSTIGPPAGKASYPDGWAVLSEFYYLRNRAEGREDWTLPGGERFSVHGRAHTARHELGHLLGLSHHEKLANAGFPEAAACKRHEGAHHDCLMSCGSGDDAWYALVESGKGFGLCEKCAAAARAFAAGLKEGARALR